jgi:hypothetical protein
MWKDWIECEYLLNRELFFFHLTLVPNGKAVGGAVTGGRWISGAIDTTGLSSSLSSFLSFRMVYLGFW